MRPSISALYCDDIRQETGGKLSYMGTYNQSLLLAALPAVLPKLCVMVKVSVPTSEVNFEQVIIRVLHDDAIIGEGTFQCPNDAEDERIENESGGLKVTTLMSHFVFSPFVINAPSSLKIRVLINEDEFKGPSLAISRAPEGTDFPQSL